MKTFQKDDINFIGIFRGIEQYEIKSDMSLLLLKTSDNYYLSKVSNNEDYNTNIIKRINNFYIDGVKALGELTKIE